MMFRVAKLCSIIFVLVAAAALKVFAQAGPTAAQFEGKWTDNGNCAEGVQITVFGDRIQFAWPKGTSVERIVSEFGGQMETIVVSDDSEVSQKNHKYRYTVQGDKALMKDLTDGGESIITRC